MGQDPLGVVVPAVAEAGKALGGWEVTALEPDGGVIVSALIAVPGYRIKQGHPAST